MKEVFDLQLSIIVPVYNVEAYIRPCIESIFRQGLDENIFEVIIINDGTEDHSMGVIEDIIEQHQNIIVLNQENQGISVARNNGIAAAKGEYILMPDSDDLFIDKSLKPLLQKAIDSKVDLLVADFLKMTNEEIESTKIYQPIISDIKIEEKTGEQMFFEFLKPDNYSVWRTFYRNDFLKQNKIKFYPGIYCQDKPFTHEVYLRAQKCIKTSWPIYIYRCHSGSISHTMSERYAKDYCKIISIMWDMASNMDIAPRFKKKMYDYTFNAFSVMSSRLIHEYKNLSKSNEIIDYLNFIAPNLNFQHGIKQKLSTMMLKKSPHTYLRLRYLYSIIWEDSIHPFIRHHF